MTAQVIDGVALSRQLRARTGEQTQALLQRTGRRPGLAVILVGDDPASAVYVRHKVAACEEFGLHSVFEKYEAATAEALVLDRVAALNADPTIHGLLVQMPLPRHLDPQAVIAAIDPRKDVDGFHPLNGGALLAGAPGLVPCTPLGCMRLLDHAGVALEGARAVVIGRSNIVGRPMANLLTRKGVDATVTLCHSRTKDLDKVSIADIILAVDEPIDATQCGGKENCHNDSKCMTHDLWAKLNDLIFEYLGAVTLKELVDNQINQQNQTIMPLLDMRETTVA
mgnify:CR=1 FL=1